MRKVAVRVSDRQYQLLTAASDDTGYQLSTVIRECLTPENIRKAAEALKAQMQQKEGW
jgi:uncharacterized protein (UPF0147 family)